MAIPTWLSPLIRLIGVVIPPIQKYYNQPLLYFVMTWNSTSKAPSLASRKNDSSKITEAHEAIWVSSMEWKYTITIRNNSEYPSYNLKILQPATNSRIVIDPPLDDLKPLLANSEVSIDITIWVRVEGNAQEIDDLMDNRPEQFQNEKLVLEYTNAKQTKFYTVFDYSGNSKGENRLFTTYDFDLIQPYLKSI